MRTVGGPDIIKNNLILYLDAANYKSYPQSGSTWYDLSITKNNATAISRVSFNNQNNGSFYYDGNVGYIGVFNNQPSYTTQLTCDVWVNANPDNITGLFLASYIVAKDTAWRMLLYPAAFGWICATNTNGWYTTGTGVTAVTSPLGWNNVVGTFDGVNNRIYVNGILYQTGDNIGGTILNGQNLFLGYGAASNVANFKGNLSMIRLYNRALSSSEIIKNYNAIRGRYGL